MSDLPTNPDAEYGVIGCCLLGGIDTAIEAVEKLPNGVFFNDDCKAAFAIIEWMATQGRSIDGFTFAQAWHERYGNRPIPTEVMLAPDKVPSAANLEYYTATAVEAWRRRRLIAAGQALITKASNPSQSVPEVLAEADSLIHGEDLVSLPVFNGREAAIRLADDLERLYQLQGKRSGVATGFRSFDALTDGLQYGEMTIVAARPSMGKTALGLNMVEEACLRNDVPTLFVSCEMSASALMRRLLSSWCEIPMKTIRGGSFPEADFRKFAAFTTLLSKKPLHIVETVNGLDTSRLSAIVRRICRKHGIRLVVIDYLQKIKSSGKHEKRTYEVGEVSSAIKSLAVQTKAAFLTLAQLNRESEKDKGRIPRLADLADSGQIERDADTVALLHRDRNDPNGEATLAVAKQRDGELGIANLRFNGEFCRFENPGVSYD